MRRKSVGLEAVPSAQHLANSARSGTEPKPVTVLPARDQEPIDPLANVKQRQAKRPAFDYRPELADAKDLI
jgi:hypothetical protein